MMAQFHHGEGGSRIEEVGTRALIKIFSEKGIMLGKIVMDGDMVKTIESEEIIHYEPCY